jgi:3-dehydroquinate synthase
VVQNIMARIGNGHLCRHSVVVIAGGGSVLDMVGFAASLVHRGVRVVRVPTSVLSQCDGGVGVKNGMDEHGMKNFVGTFAPPFAVINDFAFLRTLPDRYWRGGIAEAFKVAIIKDAAFFGYLSRNAPALRRRSARHIEEAVRRAAILHLRHIASGGDPFEMGAARPLDFGHWSAHKLEMLSNYRLSHGEAVALGIALDTCYACARGLLTAAQRDRILRAMSAAGLPLWSDAMAASRADGGSALLAGLEDFREHLGGRLTVTLPRGIGARVEVHEMDASAILSCMDWLRARSPSA